MTMRHSAGAGPLTAFARVAATGAAATLLFLSLLLVAWRPPTPGGFGLVGSVPPVPTSPVPAPARSRRRLFPFRASFSDPRRIELKAPPPAAAADPVAGVRLLLVGDPAMHGQYLSLTHYLRHGAWPDPDRPPFDLPEDDVGSSVESFHARTTASLSPHEAFDFWGGREFRAYRDPDRDNTVVYLPARSDDDGDGADDAAPSSSSFRLRLWPCLSLKALQGGSQARVDAYLEEESSYRTKNILGGMGWTDAAGFVGHHMFLSPKERLRPTVVIGAGAGAAGLCGAEGREERSRLADGPWGGWGPARVWRTALPWTTTAGGDGGEEEDCGAAVDREVCAADGVACLDADAASARRPRSGRLFHDAGGDERMPRFEHPVYRALNEDLLGLIGS